MKHQYFGDVNDYRKYGLLRIVQRETGLRLGVWWMLTPDDGRSDGNSTSYLGEPKRWREYDPPLFDALAAAVPAGRSIAAVMERGLLGDALFVDALVPDNAVERATLFASARASLRAAEIVFLDPDNGLEIPSCAPGRKGSSKFALQREIEELFAAGHSILVYQHFPREERLAFVRRMAAQFRSVMPASAVGCFQTSNVAFFLLSQPCHAAALRVSADRVLASWGDEITPWFDSP
jgi:hypothetical protein